MNKFYPQLILFCSAALWAGAPESYASVCFLPDCDTMLGEDVHGENIQDGYCKDDGFIRYESGVCPQYSHQEACIYNSYYLKCDRQKWCADNGYIYRTCTVPEYPEEKCLNGLEFYKKCKPDMEKACKAENSQYTNVCPTGWQIDPSQVCRYSAAYGKCCNLCRGFDYLASSIPAGYIKGDSCTACGNITKYKAAINPCDGYRSCSNGGKTGTATCMHGGQKWYKECCNDCAGYSYTESTIPTGYVKGASCDSCWGTRYKTAVGSCGSGYKWQNGFCVDACDNTCGAGNIYYADNSCSACVISGKTPIGVVAGRNLVIALTQREMMWGPEKDTAAPDYNYNIRPDFNGENNTYLEVQTLGNSTSHAPGYCYNYSTTGKGKTKWYLPAFSELETVLDNQTVINSSLRLLGAETFSNSLYWSSSEGYASGTYRAWAIRFPDGWNWDMRKNTSDGSIYHARCVFSF